MYSVTSLIIIIIAPVILTVGSLEITEYFCEIFFTFLSFYIIN